MYTYRNLLSVGRVEGGVKGKEKVSILKKKYLPKLLFVGQIDEDKCILTEFLFVGQIDCGPKKGKKR